MFRRFISIRHFVVKMELCCEICVTYVSILDTVRDISILDTGRDISIWDIASNISILDTDSDISILDTVTAILIKRPNVSTYLLTLFQLIWILRHTEEKLSFVTSDYFDIGRFE